MVRQELASELGIVVSLRTVERSVSHLRRELAAEALATVRFETPPGRQLQIAFGGAGSRSKGRTRAAYPCLWRHSATRGGFMRRRSGTSGNRRGWRGLRARSATLAACRVSCCPITPVPWSSTMTRPRGRWSLLTAYTRSSGIGTCGRSPVRPNERAPGARTSAASATSSTTPSPGGALHRGACWRSIWLGGCAKWPTRGCTGTRARRRSCGSSARSGRSAPVGLAVPPFRQLREQTRRVQNDACVNVDTNRYSVPWRLIGAEVSVMIDGGQVRITMPGSRSPAMTSVSAAASAPSIERTCTASYRVVAGCGRCRGHRGAHAARHRTAAVLGRIRAGDGRRLVNAEVDALPDMLARLKLVALRDRLDGLLDEAARGDLSLRETLALLCRAEVSHREERRIQMGTGIAKFPHQRTLEGFDFAAQPSLDAKQVRDLAACRWVANGDALLIQGPPGVGKTHLAIALGREAIRHGYSVLFTPATALVTTLVRGHAEGRLEQRLSQLAKPKLLIVDEFGYLPFEPAAAHLLFQLVSRR